MFKSFGGGRPFCSGRIVCRWQSKEGHWLSRQQRWQIRFLSAAGRLKRGAIEPFITAKRREKQIAGSGATRLTFIGSRALSYRWICITVYGTGFYRVELHLTATNYVKFSLPGYLCGAV